MAAYEVTVETLRRGRVDGRLDHERLERFRTELVAHRGHASSARSGFTATVPVIAPDEQVAIAAALRRVIGAARSSGLDAQPLVVKKLVRAPTDDQRARAEVPDIVGAGEVLALLDISKQRLHQLRSTGSFPPPVVELLSGPIWMRTAIEQWRARDWNRRVGRPSYRRFVDRAGQTHDLDVVVIDTVEFVALRKAFLEEEPALAEVRGGPYLESEGFQATDTIAYVPLSGWDARSR